MTITTSVPPLVINDKGVTIPDESTVLAGIQADINTAFGGGVNPGLSTPQGQIAQSLTAIVGSKNDEIAAVVNLIDPDKAAGRWQDAIARIYFIDRIPASGTVVSATCTGLPGTVIPAGSVAQDLNGYIYNSLANATIAATGSVSVDFQCSTTGPIACPAGTLTRIYRAVIGWDTITNPAPGTEGADVESRADFEDRRKKSVAANAVNSPQAIQAAVLNVDGVIDAYVVDNPKSVEVAMGATNYPVAAHSIYVAAVGGEASAIAQAIWSKKSLGCNYNGNTTAMVEDMGYQVPRPSYEVRWVTPDPLPVYISVLISQNPSLPANIVALTKEAILNAFNGADGGPRARIASSIYAGRFYAGVAAISPNVAIQQILLGATAPGGGTQLISGIDQRPTLNANDITVTLV